MLFSSWLRNGNRNAPATSRRTQPSLRQRRRIRPRLEALEDRLVLSTTAIVQTNLVSDDIQFAPAQVQDPNLVNPWGLAASPTGTWWVANEGTVTSTMYDTSKPHVSVAPLLVNIPHDSPTGIVFNSGTGFKVSENGKTGPSTFLFANADGTISGWNPQVDGNHAMIGATNPGALYLGLATATDAHGKTRLYAADFAKGTIDVYDQNFQFVKNLSGKFTDAQLPGNYHPFNIQAINNRLYVEYAPADQVLAGKSGLGEGAVDVYNADGQLQEHLIRQGQLNQPWAIAMAPSNFGSFSNDLLVGNFGDGHINAFDPKNGHFVGELNDANGQPIAITHLWGLAFGNGGEAGPKNTLYFTAGLSSHLAPSDAPFHGLFGSLQVAPVKPPMPPGNGLPYPTAATVSQLVADINYADSAGGAITINLAPNTTFTLQNANNANDGGNALPVIGGTKAVDLTILGNGDIIERVGSSGFHQFDVALGASLTLDHATLQDGRTSNSYSGVAIYNQGRLKVSNSTLSHIYGGGIDNAGGTVTVSNSTLSGNAANYGGGIANYGGTVTVSNSTLSSNGAVSGGGIYNAGGTVIVSNSMLSGNYATFGGGIDNAYGGTVTVSSSTLSGNYATPDYSGRGGEGGGIYNGAGMVTISSSILSSNFSQGAGIYNDPQGTVTLKNSSSIFGNMTSGGDYSYYEDVDNLGVLYLDSTSTIYYLEGNSAIPI